MLLCNLVLLIIKHYDKKKSLLPWKIQSILNVDEYFGKQEDNVSTDKLPSKSINA